MTSSQNQSEGRPDLSPTAELHRTHLCRPISWAAVFAGLMAAVALQVLFMLLGAGLGFAIYTPLTDANPITELGKGAVIVQGVSAVFSLWFGGWIAGRFTPASSRRSGCLHGFIVWCAATVTGVLIVSFGAGWALGDLSKLVGGGLSMAGKPAAAVTSSAVDSAKDAVKKSIDTLGSFVDEATGRPSNSPGYSAARAKREIGASLARLFTPALGADQAANRTAAVQALVQYSGVSAADAERMVTEWTDSYNRMKADLTAAKNEAEQKAREAADQAADVLAMFSLGAFVAFVFGALSATCGGSHGAKCATRHDAVAVL